MIGYRPSALGSALVSSFLLVALLGCQRHDENATRTGPPPMEVAVTTVSPRALPVSFDAVGQTAGSREVEVRARVGGILQEQLSTEGVWVKAGTVLFKIDPAPYQAALSKAQGVLAQEEAQLAKATQDLERMRRLVDQGFVARKDAVAEAAPASCCCYSAR